MYTALVTVGFCHWKCVLKSCIIIIIIIIMFPFMCHFSTIAKDLAQYRTLGMYRSTRTVSSQDRTEHRATLNKLNPMTPSFYVFSSYVDRDRSSQRLCSPVVRAGHSWRSQRQQNHCSQLCQLTVSRVMDFRHSSFLFVNKSLDQRSCA